MMLFMFIPAPVPPGGCMYRFISRGMLQHYGPLDAIVGTVCGLWLTAPPPYTIQAY